VSSPLYSRVRSRIDFSTQQHMPPEERDLWTHLFQSAEVISSTNVTEYYFAGTDQEFWHLDRDFPNLAPVYDSFFIETKHPTHIRSEMHGTTRWDEPFVGFDSGVISNHGKRPHRWGAWFINVLDKEFYKYFAVTDSAMEQILSNVWTLCITLFVQYDEDGPVTPFWNFVLLVHKETGAVVPNPLPIYPGLDNYSFLSAPLGTVKKDIENFKQLYGSDRVIEISDPGTGRKVTADIQGAYSTEAMGFLKPLLLAVSFMHCRNVERVANHVSHKLNKKRVARNVEPLYKFHTLKIAPMQRIIDQAAQSYRGSKTGITMALHKVRGHFKTYTPEKPLMGHAVGSWFWGPIQRGSKKRGVVVKEYEVSK
jgi:hypothetical protein